MEELIEKLKEEVIDVLDLEEVKPDDFDGDTPLFFEGLGLDSIDALELIVLMEREYGIKIEDPKDRRTALYSIRTMAEFITHGKVNKDSIPQQYREIMENALAQEAQTPDVEEENKTEE